MILVTGRGSSASWQIRGVQLGTAIGGKVEPNAGRVTGHDCAIVVKRARSDLLRRLHDGGVPVVWDVVDAWPQPDGNNWDREQCMAWLRTEVKAVKPVGIVAATKAMAADCAEFEVPVLALPHHARPGQRINPIRGRVQTVGFQGGEQYLGDWLRVLESECSRRRWNFVVNPPELADVDIAVAVRTQVGYAPRKWKSNVKLANCQGSGTPVICNHEAGYLETADGGVYLADDASELSAGLDLLADLETRRTFSRRLLVTQPRLEDIAETYKAWLARLRF